MRGTVIAGALGNCVHVAGVAGFLDAAERLGYHTEFLGAAVAVEDFVEAVRLHNPEIVGVSYRLTPDVGRKLVSELRRALTESGLADRKFVFAGTRPVCEAVEGLGWFEAHFSGLENPDAVWCYLKGEGVDECAANLGDTLRERISAKRPYPLLRHHFGLPGLQETIDGVRRIAESGLLDVISLAPDQNAQESFFRPEVMDPMMDGAGGVPVRSREDMLALYQASRCGNYPLIRVYSGTRDLLQWAQMSKETVDNAWAAVPLCWYSALDGRSKRNITEAIAENHECMRWHAERGIPVEVNEAHHWALRDSHDVISVAMAYLAAYNAKACGVRDYVAQYMFNTPPNISPAMDMAKIRAQVALVESLHDSGFQSIRQARAGLLHLSPLMNRAKGQLAASTLLALSIDPQIIHVVGYCEGDHAASADDVLESCEIVHGVLKNCLAGVEELTWGSRVEARTNELISEARLLLDEIRRLDTTGEEDPLASPQIISKAIQQGLLDAPHLKGNSQAAGRLVTRVVDGAVVAVDPETREPLNEEHRLQRLSTNKKVD